VTILAGVVEVQYDKKMVSVEQFKAAVKEVGYGVDAANPEQFDSRCCG